MARRRRRRSILPIGRLFGPPATLLLLVAGGVLSYLGYVPYVSNIFGTSDSTATTSSIDPQFLVPVKGLEERSPDKLRIGTFNIQVFGDAKVAKPKVPDWIAYLVRQFDVLAIQEIKCDTDDPITTLMNLVNGADDSNYSIIMSKRLKRPGSNNSERYAFIWDTAKVQLREQSAYEVEDNEDLMHREPFVASFRTVPASTGGQPFTFTLINVHTDPDTALQEMNVMDDVFLSVRAFEQEDDVIVLGDLNVEANEFGELGKVQGIRSLNTTETTNTAGTRTIDHIVIDSSSTTEFLQTAGVIQYGRNLNLTREQAKLISDHCPVYAEFDVSERVAGSVLAARPTAVSPN